MLAGRVTSKVVSEMLGLATPAITLDVSRHVGPGIQHDTVAMMERVLYGYSPQQKSEKSMRGRIHEFAA